MENKKDLTDNTRAALLDFGAEVITDLYCGDAEKTAELITEAIENGGDQQSSRLDKMLHIAHYAFMKGARAALYAQEEDEEAFNAALAARIMEISTAAAE